ncbi:MAG: YqgE/AlgH family protein [Bacteroidetes bacterium]|nr:YqgE/AlgH family protein [Bacteroidota bacterium]
MKKSGKPSAGMILISEPALNDYFFRQSVVLLADHGKEGSFGVIVNKPLDSKLNEVVKGFPEFDAPVFLGGPVKTDSLFFIHRLHDIEGSLRIFDGLYWGGNLDRITELIRKNLLSHDQIRFFVGYSGWSPNQLDREISENSWIISQTNIEEIISPHPEHLWTQFIRSLGSDYAIWANFPPDPQMN